MALGLEVRVLSRSLVSAEWAVPYLTSCFPHHSSVSGPRWEMVSVGFCPWSVVGAQLVIVTD